MQCGWGEATLMRCPPEGGVRRGEVAAERVIEVGKR